MPEKKVPKAKKMIPKPDKQVPKIRIVRLNENLSTNEGIGQAESCACQKCPCPCDSDPSCVCQPVQCGCLFNHISPSCSCLSNIPVPSQKPCPYDSCPCEYHPPSCRTVIPQKSKVESRTFFKIAKSEKDYYPLLPGLIREYRLKDLEGEKTVEPVPFLKITSIF